MSNAMRSGKRALAALAAGALGAGLITFVGAPAAQASTAATVALQYPSVTAVISGVSSNTAIPVQVRLFNTAGDQVTGATALTGQRVQITITQPATADDTSVVIANGTGTFTGGGTQNLQSAVPNDLLTVNFQPRTGYATWDSIIGGGSGGISDAGTYTITARLFNTSTGAVVSTATMPLNLIANTATTTPSIAFISGPAISQTTPTDRRVNILDRVGATAGIGVPATAASAPQSFALWVTDPAGGPYIMNDDSVTVASTTKVSGTITTIGGWDNSYNLPQADIVNYSGDLRVSYTSTGGTYSSTPGVGTLVATAATPGATGTGSLPLSLSSATALSVAPSVILTTTPSFDVAGSLTAPVYQVPPGTTKLTFTTITSDSLDDTTIPWDAWSTQNLTALSSSGGVINQKADTGALEINLPAAATAAGRVLTLNVGVAGKNTTFTVQFAAPTTDLYAPTPLAQVGQAATIKGTITDQYGNPLPGTWGVSLKAAPGQACATATNIATAVAAADGAFTITVPASFSPTTAQLAPFGICASNGITTVPGDNAGTVNVRYTATGGVSSLTLTDNPAITGVSATVRPLIKTPANGTASLSTQTAGVRSATTTVTSALINASTTTNVLKLTGTVSPATTVTYSGSEGILFTERNAGSIFYAQADATLDVIADSTTGQAPVSVIATKPGLHTVTVTAGTSTATYTLYAAVPNTAARVLEVTPATFQVTPNSFRTISLKVTDIFGNAVPFYNGFDVVQAGAGTLSPAATAMTSVITGADGIAQQFYTAPAGTGDTRLQYVGNNWVTGPIAGAPDAVDKGVVNIKVALGPDPEEKTILIVGERTTVSGKPGIRVEGDTTGFKDGDKVKPWIRFPGQTEYTVGTARPTINAVGEFSWQRKTGKKTYVYFTNEAGDVRSNRVIIAAN